MLTLAVSLGVIYLVGALTMWMAMRRAPYLEESQPISAPPSARRRPSLSRSVRKHVRRSLTTRRGCVNRARARRSRA